MKKESCCGCGICAAICPYKAIRMIEDEHGFRYPVIDQTKCVDCGACDRICAYQHDKEPRWNPQKTYVAVTKNTEITKSASGGIFASLAANVLKEGGIVYGCAMREHEGELIPEHIGIETLSDLYLLTGSKYVQSSITEICSDVKKQVISGRKVLFSGTPCQVSAIRSLLNGRTFDNLLLIDIVCHGVPSARFFCDYISDIERRRKGKVIKFTFRDKAYGWSKTGSYVIERKGKTKKYVLPFMQSSYYAYFMNSDIYRESCYHCKYACKERVGDITIGDYWGVRTEHPEFLSETGGQIDRQKGVSCMLINTTIGEQWLEKYKKDLLLFPSLFEKAAKNNTQLRRPSPHGKEREKVLELYRAKGYHAVEKYYRKSLGIRWHIMMFKRIIPQSIKKPFRKMMDYLSDNG